MKLIIVSPLIVCLVGIGIFAAAPAGAQEDATPAVQTIPKPETPGLSSDLAVLRDQAAVGKPMEDLARAHPLVRFKDSRVGVSIRCLRVDEDLLGRLRDLGVEVQTSSEHWAQVVGWCDPGVVEQIALLPEVASVYPNYQPISWAGSVSNQADVSIRAANARSTYGVDGSGVTVGVLSDSFHTTLGGTIVGNILTGSAPQLTGDLPAEVTVLEPGTGDDEGAAMAELIYDLAPGADIAFHSAFVSDIDFAQGIGQLRAAGADVLVDDVSYLTEPFYQDGPIAQAITNAVNDGAVYFTSAGNLGRRGVRQGYADITGFLMDTAIPPTGVDFHDWGGGDAFANITVPVDGLLTVIMQWNQPFSGSLGPGSQADLDVYLYDSPNPAASIVAFSNATQGTTGNPEGDPVEIMSYYNFNTSPKTVYMAVDHYDGVRDGLEFRMVVRLDAPSGGSFQTGLFDQPQIFGHQGTAEAVTVAAMMYLEIDQNGNFQTPLGVLNVESFSSLGGDIPYYFGPTGVLLPGAPVMRFKPEITAPDGTNTTFFGSDIPNDPDSFPNFFGTSAAAPQAAGVAALMKSYNSALTGADMAAILRSTARDVEAAGTDTLSGDGLVDALDAVGASVAATPTPTPAVEAGRWEIR